MNRDIFILLFLRHHLSDPYLCKYITNILSDKEKEYSINHHKNKSNLFLYDINLLYHGFLRTALFEIFRFNEDEDIDPGFSIYNVQPLTKCGHYVNWKSIPPELINDYEGLIDSRGVTIINQINHKDKQLMKRIRRKNINYRNSERRHVSLWYDFENKEFSNI